MAGQSRLAPTSGFCTAGLLLHTRMFPGVESGRWGAGQWAEGVGAH
eukprot:SAG25_NODE_7451_length_480_cov_0.666667_1_plen_45_part_01